MLYSVQNGANVKDRDHCDNPIRHPYHDNAICASAHKLHVFAHLEVDNCTFMHERADCGINHNSDAAFYDLRTMIVAVKILTN